MLFTSPTYYLLLSLVALTWWWLPRTTGRWVLVAASYLFYAQAVPWYCLLLLSSTLVDFAAALRIGAAGSRLSRRLWLAASLAANLGMLGIFKYADFVLENLNLAGTLIDVEPLPALDLLLPIGISFYTFQTLSYTIDVYRGKQRPTRDFTAFALYVAFFPQLVAGPIERARHLLPQLASMTKPTAEDVVGGIQRILWGLMKKTVFADRLGLYVDAVYADPAAWGSPAVILAAFCFMLQLYLDFSAYSDIAIGSGRVLGIRLSENFRWPYLARNPVELWSRWHITLTTWIRDYVYRPLSRRGDGARRSATAAIMLSMLVMGLWHGAAWNFVLYGLWTGVTIAGYRQLRQWRGGPLLGDGAVAAVIAVVLMWLGVAAGLVLFRSPNMATAAAMFSTAFGGTGGWRPGMALPLVLCVICLGAHVARGLWSGRERSLGLPAPLIALHWLALITLVAWAGVDRDQAFIYFQF